MRIGDIGDVDVIPNGSAVGRRIIGAVDLERRARAQGSSQHIRDQVGLRIVVLSQPLRGARRIEVAQAHHPDALLRPDIREQPLEIALRLAVRIHRHLRRVFRDRNRRRMAVDRARRREDEAADSGADCRLQQYTSSRHIVGHILLRLGDRLRDYRKSGQMDDRLDALALEERLDQLAVPHTPLDEARAPGDRLAVPRAQVIQHNDLETALQELIYDDTADVPCPAGDENPCHAGGSIPKSRRTASSRPYPWPSSAAFFRAMVGWCRNLFSNTWLNCSTWARSSGLR